MPDRFGPDLDLSFTLNDATVAAPTTTSTTLADLLRQQRGGRGTKLSCERSVCGACTVLIDGVPRASCAVFAFEVEGSTVRTVEGLAPDRSPGRPATSAPSRPPSPIIPPSSAASAPPA